MWLLPRQTVKYSTISIDIVQDGGVSGSVASSIWLLQEADKNETESQDQIPNDAWRKNRSKYKKYMSNIYQFKVLYQMVVACPYIQRVQDLKSIYIYILVADISVVESVFLSKC